MQSRASGLTRDPVLYRLHAESCGCWEVGEVSIPPPPKSLLTPPGWDVGLLCRKEAVRGEGHVVGPGTAGGQRLSSDMTSRPFRYDFSLWYCLEDDPIATSISATLRAKGFRGYVEHQDQAAGAPVVAAAGEIIEASRVALLLLSRRSVADRWCQRVAEWNLLQTVLRDGSKVVPIYVDVRPREVPVALRYLTGLDYHSPFFQERLLKSLQSGPRPGSGHPRPPKRGRF